MSDTPPQSFSLPRGAGAASSDDAGAAKPEREGHLAGARAGGGAHRIERPLRLRWIERRLDGRPDAAAAMRQALVLDARMHALAVQAGRTDVDAPERTELVVHLTRLRLELDALVAGAGRASLPAAPPLSMTLRVRLAELLGVPPTPEYEALIALKAIEHHEQGCAFDQVAADFGFVSRDRLGEDEKRGALVLTMNGSLLQVSAPGADGRSRSRRFVYQNIYGGRMPAEGTLELTRAVSVGKKLRTKHMETSPVRKLCLAVRPEAVSPEHLRRTFDSVSLAMSVVPQRSRTMWGASPGWHPTVVAQSVARERSELLDVRAAEAMLGAREELREHLLRFADPRTSGGDPVLEADILGLCMYLQRQRAERGEPCFPLEHLAVFVTDRGERCSFEHHRGRVHAVLERPAREPLPIPDAGLIEQAVARGAPVALVDAAGSIAAVLGDVVWIQARQSS